MKARVIFWGALAVTGWAGASPITFTISTSGSGSLGALAFTDATIVITDVTDTTFILNGPIVIGNQGNQTPEVTDTDTVTIVGLNTWTLTDPVLFYDDRTFGIVGALDYDAGINTLLNLLDISGTAFSTYDLKSSIGPISDPLANGSGTFIVPTSGGTLSFTTNSTNASFQAVTSATPEPGSLWLMAIGAMGLHALRSRIVRRGYDLHKSCAHRNCPVTRRAGDASGAGARRQRGSDFFC
jgi:PEP-CTERM motif